MKQKLVEILGLPPGATESDIVKAVAELVTERKQAQTGAIFEGRVAALVMETNMCRTEAIRCLQAQDAANAQNVKIAQLS